MRPRAPAPRWLIVNDLAIAVLVMPKCGAQTVYSAIAKRLGVDLRRPAFIAQEISGCEFVWAQQLEQRFDLERICITRDPVDRFKSLWKNKCRDGTTGIPSELYGVSPDELLDAIVTMPYGNPHWSPQADWEYGLSHQLVPIDQFHNWWGDDIEIWNETKGDVLVDEDRIRNIYRGDVLLHARAQTDYERWLLDTNSTDTGGNPECLSIH
jgi:hypothetical protein